MPAENWKCCFEFLVWKFVCFYESDHAFKTIWRLPCLCHLIKIKGYFFQPGRLLFVIVLRHTRAFVSLFMPSKNGARALFEFLPGINSKTSVLTLSIYSTKKYFDLNQDTLCLSCFLNHTTVPNSLNTSVIAMIKALSRGPFNRIPLGKDLRTCILVKLFDRPQIC